MTLVLVEVLNEEAVERLRQQPGVQVVGVVTKPVDAPSMPSATGHRQWAGSIPASSAEEWDKHLQTIRNEWRHDT